MAHTLDGLPAEARARAERLLANLPRDWHVVDVDPQPQPDGISYVLHMGDESGQPNGATVMVYQPGFGVEP